MSDQDSALFLPFAGAMAKRKQDQPGGGEKKPVLAGASPPVVRQKKREADNDAALFMNAVASVVPKKDSAASFATPFAALATDAAGKGAKRGKKNTAKAVPAGQSQHTGTSEAVQELARQKADATLWEAAMNTRGPLKNTEPEPAPVPLSPEEDVLFAKAMHGVAHVVAKGRDVPVEVKNAPNGPAGQGVDMAALLGENFEFALSHNTDEYMEGFVVGTDPMVVGKLKAGSYSPEAHLDLHGQNSRQALDALMWFIKSGYQRNLRCVLVITGRGKNSPDKVGVLRTQLQTWLTREPFKRVVQAFCTAQASDGGPGAAYVLLRKTKKTRGKIVWECQQYSDEYYDL